MSALQEALKRIADNDEKVTTFRVTEWKGAAVGSKAFTALAEALKTNTHVVELDLQSMGVTNQDAVALAEAIAVNNSLTKLNLSYNQIGADGIIAIAQALAKNKSIVEGKIERQQSDYGMAAEQEVAKIYQTNTTLTRLYSTLHDRRCNQDNSRGEVRNKEIARRKEKGLDWLELDPASKEEYAAKQAAEREKKKEEAKLADVAITTKIESTGGPYTLKQLTVAKDLLPDDIDLNNKEVSLSDEEFQQLFGSDKATFAALPGWKKLAAKKAKNLH
jgi:hypothetical protein